MKEYLFEVQFETRVRVKAETLVNAKLLLLKTVKDQAIEFSPPDSESPFTSEPLTNATFELIGINGEIL